MKILKLDVSPRGEASISRQLSKAFFDQLPEGKHAIKSRFIDEKVSAVSGEWLGASWKTDSDRTAEEAAVLKQSDEFISEISESDVIVLSTPIWNFSIPAQLKAWIDQICRAGLTFKYTENGPVGLMTNKKAIVFIASGGTKLGGPVDYGTPHLRFIFNFIGINDVTFVAADQTMVDQGESFESALKDAKQLAIDLG